MQKFDEILQTKTSKITAQELQTKNEKSFVARNELDAFISKATASMSHQEQQGSIQKLMIEELSKQMKKQI